MDDREIINHLMDIKERLSVIESKQDMHIHQHTDLKNEVAVQAKLLQINTDEITQAKAALRTLRWVGGALLVSIPATAAAIVKALHGG